MALPLSLRYFDIFGMYPSFDIDQASLKKRYFELSRRHHPDRLHGNMTRETSIEEVNKAYSVLRDDFLRAKYLSNGDGFKVDKEFLVDMLEYEEAISNICSSEEEGRIRKDLEDKIAECRLNFANKEYLCKWGYYERLRSILDRKKNSIEG